MKGLALVILLAVFLGISVIVLSSFTQNTIAQCQELVSSTYNDTTINGDGVNVFNLYNYLNGDAKLDLTNITDNGTIYIPNCWVSPFSQNLTIPHNCLSIVNLSIGYQNVNITNASITYNSLGTCAYPTNTYKALSDTSALFYGMINIGGIFLLALFAIMIVFVVIKSMGGG
jgi:hypothetical protein